MINFPLYYLKGVDSALQDNNQEKKKRFKIFDSQREGKGVEKSDFDKTPNLKRFFRLYKDNLNKLLSLNIVMVLGLFPVIFLILGLSDVMNIGFITPASDIYSAFRAVLLTKDSISPSELISIGIDGLQISESARTLGNYIFFALSLLTFFTFGFVNVGAAYVTRNIIKGDPVFVYSDFIYAIRRNWKQALPFGMLDLFLSILILFNVWTTLQAGGGLFNGVLFWANLIFGLIYFFMRNYYYLQMVTFDLKSFKIIKNSLIFALIGWKRNLLAILGVLLLLLFNLTFVFGFGGVLLPVGIAFPLIALLSHSVFMTSYAAYYKIKEMMIDPYYDEYGNELETEEASENA